MLLNKQSPFQAKQEYNNRASMETTDQSFIQKVFNAHYAFNTNPNEMLET